MRIAVLCALVATSGPALARPRLSPALGFVATQKMPPEMLPLLPDGRLQVWIKFAGSADALRAAGVEPVSHAGLWWTARVRADRLTALPDGAYVEEAHQLSTQLDRSVAATGAIVARGAQPDLDGHGVVVGIVDTGIDIAHEDFRRPDGTTRVVWLEDVSSGAGGLHPNEATTPQAAVWNAADIDRALAQRAAGLPAQPALTERDLFGHGTHVAGIAAGNGRGTGAGLAAGRYVGMAPGADLVIVKATRGSSNGFTDADIADGVSFVFERAAALGEPAVANLSLGAQGGSHAGHAAMEEMLSAMVGDGQAGRVIVVAAGNDGGNDIHSSGELAGRQARIPIEVAVYPPPPLGSPRIGFGWQVWYPMSGSATIAIVTPGGRRIGPMALGHSGDWSTSEGHVYLDHGSSGVDPAAERVGIYGAVQQSSDGSLPAMGRWQIELEGDGHFDLWLTGESLPSTVRVRGEVDPDDHLTLPGTAENLISVAAYTTKSTWTSFLGQMIERGLQLGAPSYFSGTGPTADGRFKPDLAAPGEFITSSLSHDALPSEPQSAFHTALQTLWADDGVHGLLRGTSMATPHVTGAVALLLQKRPDLDAPRMRELLRATARTDADFTRLGDAWNPKWGFGKLAVDVAARLLDGAAAGRVDPAVSAVGTSRDVLPPRAAAGASVVSVVPKDASGLPLGPGHAVEITASSGRWLDEVTAVSEFGRYERRLVADRPGAAALVTVRVDGVVLARHPTVWFVDSRADIGAQYEAAGSGCALLARGGAAGPGAALVVFGLLLMGRARGRKSISRQCRRTPFRRRTRCTENGEPRFPPRC